MNASKACLLTFWRQKVLPTALSMAVVFSGLVAVAAPVPALAAPRGVTAADGKVALKKNKGHVSKKLADEVLGSAGPRKKER